MSVALKRGICMTGLAISLCALCYGQSLGDVAREERLKQAAKKGQAALKVITNEDLPEHSDSLESGASSQANRETGPSRPMGSKSAEQWRAEIAAQRRSVEALQSQIDRLNSSRVARTYCLRNCVQWNEHQIQRQDEVEHKQAELEEQKRKLEDMQEAARKEGYGNAVYEP